MYITLFTTYRVTRRDKKKSESKSSSSQNPTKSSPQMEKKQLIPLPPSPPAVTNMIDKLDIKVISMSSDNNT